jgi:ubiquitin-protein ligase
MSLSSITEKRIKSELKNLKRVKIPDIQVIQDEDDKFTFYFLLRGIKKSDYEGGYYLGKIILPTDYPKSPVDYKMMTPSGRFMINSSICLTNSKYHKDQWSPSWNLENMTVGFMTIFNDDTEHGISHINEPSATKKLFAQQSINYNLKHYPKIFKSFDQFVNPDGSVKTDAEVDKESNEFKLNKKKKKQSDKNDDADDKKGTNDEEDNNKADFNSIIASAVPPTLPTPTPPETSACTKDVTGTKLDLINSKLNQIKHMSFENFDINVYSETYDLLSMSLPEL